MFQSSEKGQRGKQALDQYFRTRRAAGRPLVFLDFDDVICVSRPYGGHDVFQVAESRPEDLYEKLWHPPARETLQSILDEHQPEVVITTSWLLMSDQVETFRALFRETGLPDLAACLHNAWEAPGLRGVTRLGAIERWLHANYCGQPFVVLDDDLSGTGLRGSQLDKAGCVVFCEQDMGLHSGHLPRVRAALRPIPCDDSGALAQ
jgi:hypothetical protein